MDEEKLKRRTKGFALRIIKLADKLPKTQVGSVVSRQIIRAGTSVGANYRAVCRAKSKPDFAAKMGIVIEEADECCYWLEIYDELTAIFVSSQKTIQNQKSQKSKIANQKLTRIIF